MRWKKKKKCGPFRHTHYRRNMHHQHWIGQMFTLFIVDPIELHTFVSFFSLSLVIPSIQDNRLDTMQDVSVCMHFYRHFGWQCVCMHVYKKTYNFICECMNAPLILLKRPKRSKTTAEKNIHTRKHTQQNNSMTSKDEKRTSKNGTKDGFFGGRIWKYERMLRVVYLYSISRAQPLCHNHI